MTKPRMFLFGAIFFFIVMLLWFIIGCPPLSKCPGTVPIEGPPPPRVILKVVGPWDSQKDLNDIISKFNAYKKKEANGFLDVIIKYETITDKANYEDSIREMQFEGEGPNIYMIFNSWVPKYQEKILPMPPKMMSLSQFKNTFAKVTVDDLTTSDGKIYSLPFYVDTLALYYDEARFENEGLLEPPTTWNEFKNYVEKLTILDENGNIEKAGAAFGGGDNVNRSPDVLILLAMQNNFKQNSIGDLVSFNKPGSIDAVQFYTDFTNPTKRFYTWDENQIYSIDAFTQRKTAMMINYSHHIDNVIKKTDGTLRFKTAPIPQLDVDYKVNYASYWVPVVPAIAPCRSASSGTDCYSLAWEFLNFAAKQENIKSYLDSTNKVAANLKLAQEQANDNDNIRSAFASQVITAKSWKHINDEASDTSLLKMINSIITEDEDEKKTIGEAMLTAKTEIRALDN